MHPMAVILRRMGGGGVWNRPDAPLQPPLCWQKTGPDARVWAGWLREKWAEMPFSRIDSSMNRFGSETDRETRIEESIPRWQAEIRPRCRQTIPRLPASLGINGSPE